MNYIVTVDGREVSIPHFAETVANLIILLRSEIAKRGGSCTVADFRPSFEANGITYGTLEAVVEIGVRIGAWTLRGDRLYLVGTEGPQP